MNLIRITLCVLLLSACTTPNVNTNKIYKITVAFGGGEKPAFWAIQVDSALNYKTFEIRSVNDTGYYEGHIRRGQWDSIVNKFNEVNYTGFKNSYRNLSDDNEYEVVVKSRSGIKRITGSREHLPANLNDLLFWFVDNCRSDSLKLTKSKTHFDTKVQLELDN